MRSPAFLLSLGLALIITAVSVWWFLQTPASKIQTAQPAPAAVTLQQNTTTPVTGEIRRDQTAPNAQTMPPQTTPDDTNASVTPQFEPLPQNTEEFDNYLLAQLRGPLNNSEFAALITQTNIVDRTAIVIMNFAKGQIARNHLPIMPARGSFVVSVIDGKAVLAAENRARYLPYVEALEKFDTLTLAQFYRHVSPVFETAYAQLGEPGTFAQRLRGSFDLVLATPDIADRDIVLVRPKVLFQYARPELESLPPVQKLMLRIGAENRARVKAVIQNWRAAIAP